MTALSLEQLENGYFNEIGGFADKRIIHTVAEYDGSDRCCIAPTQLNDRFSDRECKKILDEWISFLKENPTAFKALHINSYVPARLFEAVCCQQNLEELRLKWGKYADLTSLSRLQGLRRLYLGSCPSVADITPVTRLKHLHVLYMENFKLIEDYSSLVNLEELEQLVISGATLTDVKVKDIDFLCEMKSLVSLWLPNVNIVKRYSSDETEELRNRCSHIKGIYGQEWWK